MTLLQSIGTAFLASLKMNGQNQDVAAPFFSYFHDFVSPTTFLTYQLPNVLDYQRRCQAGIASGTVPSPTARLMLLGDSGVGKTSTARHLVGRPHPMEHDPTEAAESSMAEWTFVDDRWSEVPRASERKAETSALALYCAEQRARLPRNSWISWLKRLGKLTLLVLSIYLLHKTVIILLTYFNGFFGDAIKSPGQLLVYLFMHVSLFMNTCLRLGDPNRRPDLRTGDPSVTLCCHRI